MAAILSLSLNILAGMFYIAVVERLILGFFWVKKLQNNRLGLQFSITMCIWLITQNELKENNQHKKKMKLALRKIICL